MSFDIRAIRRQFPILSRNIGGQPLCYLDNAATTQKPATVIDALTGFYTKHNANVNRGVHILAEETTVAYDEARKTVATFVGAMSHEIIFTRNATEGINLVARSWGETTLQEGDAVALSIMEHHSNIVPWLQLKERKGIRIEWIGINAEGTFSIADLKKALKKPSVKLVSVTGLSNVLGTRPPLEKIIGLAHAAEAKVLVDAAQLIAHTPMNVRTLDVDFLAFSGHKLYGPMGVGVLVAKEELLRSMPPFFGGGDMIQNVTQDTFTPAELPRKFEAGTPSVADAIGLAAAMKWINDAGMETIAKHEHALIAHAQHVLSAVEGVHILGPANADDRTGCISFTIEGVHPHDLTDILGQQGICLRAGHHCTQPLHRHLKINASTRLSVAAYNTKEEIERCVIAIEKAQRLLNC
ncbi:MAG: SufS family cysteine desulfurase [Candidatus Peribacteraceae bacterium]|nr:SufS family cysteine desulfurase [Candidatus Peribacteraceae bacterium]